MKRDHFKLIIYILLPFLVISYFFTNWESRKFQNDYFNKLHLKMTGIIRYIGVKESSNGFGIIGADILTTNMNYLDQRGNNKFYYCIIKNNRAEIYQAGVIDCAVGDSISIDTDKRQFTIKKSSGEQLVNYIILYDNESFFEYARKNFQKL